MKKILFRKLLYDYLVFFTIALFASSLVVWIFQAVNFLDIIIEDSRDYLVYINYSLLNFPKILSRLFPFVLFFSLFYVLDKREQENELMIFWNFGVTKFNLINFFFKFSLVLLFIQVLLTALVVPKMQNLARSFIKESNISDFGNFIKPQKFNDTITGVTIFSEKKDSEGFLYNIYVKRELEENDFLITYAEKGKFTNYKNTPVLKLFNGETISKKKNEITNFSFSKTDFVFKDYKTNTTTVVKTQETSTMKLFKCITQVYKLKNLKILYSEEVIFRNCNEKNIGNIVKEIYKRLIIPFYIPLLTLISLSLILFSKESIIYKKNKFIIFFLGLVVVILSEMTIRFISTNLAHNLNIFVIPFILICTIYFILFLNLKYSNK